MSPAKNVRKTLLSVKSVLLVSVLALASPVRAAGEPLLYLVDTPFDAPTLTRIYVVDPATGALTLRADLGSAYAPALAIAAASESVFYLAASDPTGAACQLNACLLLKVVLDPASTTPQSVTVVGPFHRNGMNVGEITGLTFRSNNALYADSQINSGLYIVDLLTAAVTLVGVSNVPLHGGDLTFDAEDHLWAWTNGGTPGFYELDPLSGFAIPVDVSPPDACAGLAALGHTNNLYAASTGNDSLHQFEAGVGSTGVIVPLSLGGSPFDHKRGDLDSPACTTGAFCTDADACTDDACEPGGCRHVRRPSCCTTAAECDDQNPCTTDACASATCTHSPLNGGQTTCGTGACQRSVVACVAGVPQSCQPGLPSGETCNGIDDDCDGATDESVPAPAAVPAVQLTRPTGGPSVLLTWSAVPGAMQYQAVQGSLASLRSSHGNFSVSVNACLGAHMTETFADVSGGLAAGTGTWYLVRPASCSMNGTWDEPGPALAAPRDLEIAAAPASCP